jgi:hypothetical protein
MSIDFKQREFDHEQKRGYNIFTREALIDIVMRKNKEIKELYNKISELQNAQHN